MKVQNKIVPKFEFIISPTKSEKGAVAQLPEVTQERKNEVLKKWHNKELRKCGGFPVEVGFKFWDDAPYSVTKIEKISSNTLLITAEMYDHTKEAI